VLGFCGGASRAAAGSLAASSHPVPDYNEAGMINYPYEELIRQLENESGLYYEDSGFFLLDTPYLAGWAKHRLILQADQSSYACPLSLSSLLSRLLSLSKTGYLRKTFSLNAFPLCLYSH
jgi:hypothetical protein